uniref:NocS n=1 Tax=Nodularia sp. HBU26 TaxID=1966654 RepID=A0A1S7B4G2_9CYAN|nr:NocS [Nodularia sp. HBU26]
MSIMSNNLISNQSVLAFDGQDDYLVIPNQDAINFDQNQNFCIELWLKIGTIEPGSNTIFDVNIIEKWQGSAFPYAIRYSSTKGTVYGSRYDGKNPSVSSKIVVNDQKFHHVAFVKQDSQLFLYIDGIEQSQTQDTTIQSTQNSSPLYVAAGTSISKGGGTRRFFAGQIADLRLWNIARTIDEIQQNMNSRLTGNEPGLVGYYPLNGDGNDKTSNANHGTINDAIWQQEELPFKLEPVINSSKSSVLQFDGQDDCVNLGKKSAFKIEKSLTIEAWIYAEAQKGYAGILSNIFDTGLTESGYGLLLDGKSGIYLGLEASSQSQQHMPYLSSGANTLNLNQWHHVAGTYNGEQMKVYIDGVEKASLDISSSAIKYEPENDLLIGMFKDDNEFYPFQGKIAEVRLWNCTRSAEEIKADMNRYLVGNEAGLVGYWPLNEGSGNIVTDKTSQGNNGTINGAIWQQAELPIPAAISGETESNVTTGGNTHTTNNSVLFFDGIDDNLTITQGFPTIDKAITIELWAKGENSVTESTSVIEAYNSQNARVLNVHLPWGNSCIFWDAGNDNGYNRIDKGVKLEEYNSWTHWAFVKDVATGKMFIYRNGEIWHQGEGNTKTLSGIQKFVIASSVNGSHYWKGSLTEFRIWNSARTPEEIQQNMNSRLTGNEPGLVGYYPLNGDSNDKTSNANHGLINGAIWQQEEINITPAEVPKNLQSVLMFDGKDDYVEVPYSQSLNPHVFTVSAWVKVVGGQGTWRSVITSRDAIPLSKGYIIYAGDNNKWQAWVGNNTQAWEVVVGSDVIINTWTHITSTFDGKQLKLYVNGTEVCSKNVGYALNTRCPLRIGAGFTEANPQYFYPGKILEVGVWNKALTGVEIQAQMNQRLTGKEEGLVAYLPLNEGSGSIVTNKTGEGNNGTINGAIWQQEELPLQAEISGEIDIPENQQPAEVVQPPESLAIPENQQPAEVVQPPESLAIPENQQPTEVVQPPKSLAIPENQQPTEAVLKLRKGFSFDEAILMTTLSKYAFDFFEYDDESVDDVELKSIYKAIYKNQGWELIHTIRHDKMNIRGLILKNTRSAVAHQYAISLRGTSFGYKGSVVSLDNIVSDVDWKLIDYGALSVQRAKVVQGIHLGFESVADQIQYFFKTLRGELKPSDFRRLHQLHPLRKFACLTALADAGAIRMGAEFEQQAHGLIEKVLADGEVDDDEELEKILQFLEEQLLSELSPLTEPIEVWVTGFSLGGALSQLAALSLRRWFGSADAGGLLIKVYAIASPKIANQPFIDFYNQQIGAELCYRIENALDIVPTYPYDPPFPISAIAPEGLKLGNLFLGKYANGGEAITIMGIGGQSVSISIPGLFSFPFTVPFPHSPETYIPLLQEQKQFWEQLARPVKDIARPFLLELLRDEHRRDINSDQ